MHPDSAHRQRGLCAVCDAHAQRGIGRRRGRETLLCGPHYEIWRELREGTVRRRVDESVLRWRLRWSV